MRHFFLSLAAASAALLCGIGTAHAVPAKPGLIQVTQSDGTQLTVRLVGDERRHYMLSSDGYTLTGGPDGDLYYAELSASGKLIPTKVKARPVNALTADEKAVVSRLGKELKPTYVKPMVMPAPQQTQAPVLPAAGKPAPPRRITSAQTTGRLKSLIILVESSDKKFASASAQQDFRNLLMQDGYSVNGATGSAWNYYQDNSNRLFDPEFVVVGPYKASKTSAYYAGSEGSDNVPELIVEACRLADNDVNFTDFADNGVIRDVFVFYAGRGQADSGDTQSIWPHRWDVRVNSKYLDVRFDGVQLQGYACGAELNGGYQMTAIGTFCHEFGHVLGWPDFYDTDYSASGGTAPALESFSLMCSGSYNNNSRTPPSVNILERWMVGWAEPEEVTENGLYTLAPVSENKGYLVQTPTTNDYFLLENRDTRNNKWDQPLNSAAACRGLLVYHVDYTSRYVPQWSYNTLNNNPAHECMKLVRSVPGRSSYDVPQKTFFPGANNITSLSPETNADYISWNSGKPSVSFSDIKLDGSQVRLSVKTKANLKAEVSARQYDARIAHRQFILESNGPRLAFRSIFQQRRLVGVDQQRALADISVEVGIIGIERDLVTVRRSLDFGIAQQLPFQQCIAAADRHFVDRFLLFVGLGHQHRKPQAEVGLLHRHDILVHGTGVDVKPRLYGLQFLVGVVFLHTPAKNQRHSHGRYK